MNKEFSLIDAALLVWGQRKKVMIVVFLVGLVTALISWLMPNYYKSETIFYAASPDLADPIPIGGQDKNIRIYGDDTDLDRLFTIASSYEMNEFLVDSFDLYTHYNIDKEDPKASFKVKEKLKKNFQTIKTKYRALQLSIEDKDPEKAAAMVNAARNKIEQIAQEIVKGSQVKLLKNYESNLIVKQVQNDTIAKKITEMKTLYNIFDISSQGEIYTSLITRAEAELQLQKGKLDYFSAKKLSRDSINKYASIVQGLGNKLVKIKSEMEIYTKNVSPIRQLEQELFRNIDQLNLDKERYKQLLATVNAPFTALHLVEKGQVPVQKSRPKRSVWVLLSIFMSFFSYSLFLVLKEIYKNEQGHS
jgi:tyrosine-protein kinase Etk/Wzc